MVRVGFLMNYPTSYKGAINYFRNLFYAIDKYLKAEVEPVLFVPDNISKEYIEIFEPYVAIVKTRILTRKSFPWFLDKVWQNGMNNNILLDRLLEEHKIQVVTHSSFISNKVKTINWVMDFQHLHFSELWNEKEMRQTKSFLHRLITKSDRIFLSSSAAFEDFKIEYDNFKEKVDILHFVSQPVREIQLALNPIDEITIKSKYNIDRLFIYLPNQFWSHKNHKVAFEAINILKERGLNPLLITSGLLKDFRSKSDHIEFLQRYVSDKHLESNILFLGLIPYKDVLDLFILSQCVINPSVFEGWSSTVEEAKSLGKAILLSDIKVHREQNPQNAIYFEPHNAKELADKLQGILVDNSSQLPNIAALNESLIKRTEQFAIDYLTGVKKVMSSTIVSK